MRKLTFILMVMALLLFVGCRDAVTPTKNSRTEESYQFKFIDTLYRVPCLDLAPSQNDYEFLEKKIGKFPNSIIVPFTRDGEFEDSVEAYQNGMLKDSMGNIIGPAYIFKSAVGDAWIYDINGNFIHFYESPNPHSGQGHKYKP